MRQVGLPCVRITESTVALSPPLPIFGHYSLSAVKYLKQIGENVAILVPIIHTPYKLLPADNGLQDSPRVISYPVQMAASICRLQMVKNLIELL